MVGGGVEVVSRNRSVSGAGMGGGVEVVSRTSGGRKGRNKFSNWGLRFFLPGPPGASTASV